jgi:hypothetical protein
MPSMTIAFSIVAARREWVQNKNVSKSEILQAVGRASKRSSAVAHEEMRQGLYSLATIACVAPWVGILGTVWTVPNAFGPPINGTGGRGLTLAFIFDHLATSMWFTAFGLFVGLVSLWFYRYLTGRLHTFDLEMENASLELLNQLSRLPGRFTAEPAITRRDRPMFGEKSLDELRRDEKFWRRCVFLAGTALVLAWSAQASRSFLFGALPWFPAAVSPWIHLPIIFAISYVPAYPMWVKLLRRRPGGLLALASVFCLCWSAAELVLGRHLP